MQLVNFKNILQELEGEIRAGRINQVAKKISALRGARIPDEHRLAMANLCRRTGLLTLGMKFLTPKNLTDRGRWLREVSAAEAAEYAILLQRIGSVDEAMHILGGISDADLPDVHLYRAYCHFNRWEYAEAIPHLKSYNAAAADYKKLVGEVNLAAAFVMTGQRPEARELLIELCRRAEEGQYHRLHANCHELNASLAIEARDLKAARASLDFASRILSSAQTVDQLFILKSRAFIDALESRSLAPLEEFKKEAAARSDWECLRETDLIALQIEFDRDRFNKLVFGTPFEAYRRRVYALTGKTPDSDALVWGTPGMRGMDLSTGKINTDPELAPSEKVHQVIQILLRDFYRPVSLGGLFSQLFKGDYFDIFSSPDRVHQGLRRARIWLRESAIPANIVETDGHYSLKLEGDFWFRIPLHREHSDWNRKQLLKLQSVVSSDRLYQASELRALLGLGATPFRRFTNWALESGEIERFGSGPATAYRLKESGGENIVLNRAA